MGNYTIIHEKSGVAVNFYADNYDIKSQRYYFWLGNDKVAEIPLEGYSIIYHATEKEISTKSHNKMAVLKEFRDKYEKAKEQEMPTPYPETGCAVELTEKYN